MNLLIVESPNKIQKIKSLLGADWLVGASVGHIREIPGKALGLDREGRTYRIDYAVSEDKQKQVVGLKALVAQVGKANVYVATDPDREGEGIAFHLCEVLGLNPDTTKRVTFMEITEAAIRAAIAQPRTLDHQLVAAQEARRAIDRLVGWEVSPSLIRSQPRPEPASKVPGYSAGRVQSVATRLVVDLEETIEGFAAGSGLSFPISAQFTTPAGERLPARYTGPAAATETDARAVLSRLIGTGNAYQVLSVEQAPVSSNPPPPYSTSSLQIDAVKKLRFSVAQISDLAQKLFEAGHVSYIRTDSVNLGPEGSAQAQAQINAQYGASFACPRTFKEKAGVQGGHEAIRPTHWELTSAGTTPQEQALYQLIYTRTLASQMSAAVYAQTVITVGRPGEAAGQAAGETKPDRFESRVKILTFPGYRAAYQEAEEEAPGPGEESAAEGAEGATLITPLQSGEAVGLARVQAAGRMQKPPKRFDEATLVAELEKRQIGRPSTYASTLRTIFERQYVEIGTVAGKKMPTKTLSWEAGQPLGQLHETARSETLGGDKGKMLPTARGRTATTYLRTYFAEFVDPSFTVQVEKRFDEIAEGRLSYVELVGDFDTRLLAQKAGAPQAASASRLVGEWKGLPIHAGNTTYGDSLRYGPAGAEKRYNLPEGVTPAAVSLEQAIAVLEYGMSHKMRVVGELDKLPIEGGISKAEKPYLRWKETFFNLPAGVELALLTPDMARRAVQEQRQANAEASATNLVRELDKNFRVVRKDEGAKGLWLYNGTQRGTVFETEAQVAEWEKTDWQAAWKKVAAYNLQRAKK